MTNKSMLTFMIYIKTVVTRLKKKRKNKHARKYRSLRIISLLWLSAGINEPFAIEDKNGTIEIHVCKGL